MGASQQQPTKLSAGEQNEYKLFRQRFVEHKSWQSGASFALMHSATEEGLKDAKETVELLVSVDEPDQILKVV